ncbi:MAG: FIST C-terminal domain-containing protein [Defluviitaleaceae bacterium]|nr:FIST C-terminal domain-containing protein [Defluviitaleaceae bacterium]
MIKTLIACTADMDDSQTAVDEILQQLDLQTSLLANSVAIISCHHEFVISGIAQAVAVALPFDVAGLITCPLSTGEHKDTLLLTLMVLTSDQLNFATVLTDSLEEGDLPAAIGNPYNAAVSNFAAKNSNAKPALIFAFAPFIKMNSGDDYVNIISECSSGVPCFGSLAVDDSPTFENCFVIHNGEYYSDRMTLILVYGDIAPKFYIAHSLEKNVLDKSAVVTKSAGHLVTELNGKPVLDFLEEAGLSSIAENPWAMMTLPFVLDYNDGTPTVSKTIVTITSDGSAVCAGAVPEGSTLTFAPSTKETVLESTSQVVEEIFAEITANPSIAGMLIFSCVGRCLTLGADQYLEMDIVSSKLIHKVPYLMLYSGGEICPTLFSNKKVANRFHNHTFIACVF